MIPSDEVCGRCQRPLTRRVFDGAPLLYCSACHTVKLAQTDFERLCVVRSDLDLPLPQSPPSMPSLEGLTIPRPPPAAPPRRALPGLLGLGILALVGFGLAFVGGLTALAFMTSRGPQGAPVTVRPRVVDEGPVLPRVQADALETPAPPPDPEPAPAPAVSVRGLVAEGWRHVETDPPRARGLFERALGAQPGNADANYGYGYALLTEGRPIDARPYLCRALANGDTETQREIRALVAKHHLTCN